MDEQQQQRVKEAAAHFADALRESYQMVGERGASAQQLNAEMTQQFFNSVISNLQSHAEANVQTAGELAGPAQRGLEASQKLAQESVQAYMDFINLMFSFSQAGPEATRRGVEEMKAEGRQEREGAEGHRAYFREVIEESNKRASGNA